MDCWHQYQDYQSSNQAQPTMITMIARPYNSFNPNWHPDSGVMNHITPDISNLTSKSYYSGNEQIHINDGLGLKILHIGYSSFPSQFNSKILSLKYLLHVPTTAKNILRVSKLSLAIMCSLNSSQNSAM